MEIFGLGVNNIDLNIYWEQSGQNICLVKVCFSVVFIICVNVLLLSLEKKANMALEGGARVIKFLVVFFNFIFFVSTKLNIWLCIFSTRYKIVVMLHVWNIN